MTTKIGKKTSRNHSLPIITCLIAMLISSCATAPPADKVDNYWDGYTAVAISPSGKIVAAANRFIVVLFDIEQRRQVGWFWWTPQPGKQYQCT